MKKRNIFLIIVIIFILILLCIGYLILNKKPSNNSIAHKLNVTIKDDRIDKKIMPSESYQDAAYFQLDIKNNENKSVAIDIYNIIDDISPELITNNFQYVITRNTEDNDDYQMMGILQSEHIPVSKLEDMIILSGEIPANSNYKYRVYLWLKKDIGKELFYKGSLKVNLKDANKKNVSNNIGCKNIKNAPIITDGLIPVIISNDGSVKTTKVNNKNWYNYCKQKWANAILVTEESRNKYLNTNKKDVLEKDILAYFVWIPRYSYKIWTLNTTNNKIWQEETIEINFVDTDTKDSGKSIGDWYTHPAFTFGDKELSGIWVGKFEVTGKINNPTILPNQSSIVNYNLADYFKTSLLFSGGSIQNNEVVFNGNTKYGLDKNNNTHIIKNNEWGAVAYLSHSQYGILNNIAVNDYRSEQNNHFMTGCGDNVADSSGSNICKIIYGKSNDYPQSTTGNISGIFDMSGGTGEYVMAYLDAGNNKSGLSDEWFKNANNYKYYNQYSYSTFNSNAIDNIAKCTLKTCGGDALYETHSWYYSMHNFMNKEYNFMKRGCGNYSGSRASQFCFGYGTGEGGAGTSSRVVLVTE